MNISNYPHRLRSWMFWVKLQKSIKKDTSGENFGAFEILREMNLKTITSQQWSNGACRLCEGVTIPLINDTERVFCMCSMLRWRENLDNSKYESYEKPALMSDLHKQKNDPSNVLEEVKVVLKDWTINPVEAEKPWIFISGTYGSGKTHLLRAVKNYWGPFAFYITSADLKRKLHSSLDGNKLNDFLGAMERAPILLIDDLGSQSKGQFFTDTLFSVIDTRYKAGAHDYPIFITSNLELSDFILSGDANERIGSRMANREISRYFSLTQPDYRVTGGNS